MAKIETVVREEIRRLAAKEIRRSIAPVRSAVVALKKTIGKLNRTVATLDAEHRRKKKAEAKEPIKLAVAEDEVKAARVGAKWVKTLRKKLNVSQVELAVLLGISTSGVRAWEYGNSRPRGKNRAALVALRKLGRREVKRMLETKEPAKEAPEESAKKSKRPSHRRSRTGRGKKSGSKKKASSSRRKKK